MKNTVLILILILSCLSVSGQQGFYATDSTMTVGVKIIDNGRIENGRWCEIKKGNKTIKYPPDEVAEYGFIKGKKYMSKKITYSGSSNNFFLEQLSEGELILLYFADEKHNTYFIEKDSTSFFELSKGEKNDNSYYQKQLQEISSDFPEIYNNAKLVRYNRRALSKFMNEYNNRLYKPFPYFKIGLVGLTEMSKFLIPENASFGNISQIDYKYDNSFGAGFFTDIPIVVSNFSCHMELFLTKHSYSFSTERTNGIIDFAGSISSVKIPILLRYTYPSRKISPFFNVGAIFAYNKNTKAKFYENIIELEVITDSQKGISSGLGIEYRLNYKHSLFFEVRFNKFLLLGDNEAFNSQDIQFLASFNF